jgi:nitrate reductase beta subunit
MTPTGSRRPPARRRTSIEAQLDVFLDPNDPAVIAQARR